MVVEEGGGTCHSDDYTCEQGGEAARVCVRAHTHAQTHRLFQMFVTDGQSSYKLSSAVYC